MIVNRFAKQCQSCKSDVPVGKGFAYKNGHRWLTVCASTACMKLLGLETPAPQDNSRTMSAEGVIKMPYDRLAIPFIKGLPGARFNGEDKTWKVSVKDQDLTMVLNVARKLEIEIDPVLLAREGNSDLDKEADRRAQREGLYDFQKEGVKFLVKHDRAFLADQMGLGKSVQTIVSLEDNARVLCISPASLKYNWQKEFNKWRPDIKTIVLEGRNSFKIPGIKECVITNYDILPDFLLPIEKNENGKKKTVYELDEDIKKHLKEITIISDEIQQTKNYKTKKHKKVKGLTSQAKAVIALTGTPIDNRPPDLFGVLSAMNMNVFGSWNRFVDAFNGMKNPFGGWEWGDPKPFVPEILKRVMLRRLKKDVLKELPPKTYQIIQTEMDGDLAKELDDTFNQVRIEKGFGDVSNEEFIETLNLPRFEEFSKIRSKIAKSRIKAALEIIETYEEADTPLVVFSAHKTPVETIGQREGWAYITGDVPSKERQKIVDRFQAGELKGVAITIIAGGEGLTLTRASHELFLDRDWRATKNGQAEDRCHRITQKENVLVMVMCSNHPLDIHINNLLQYKMNLMQKALETQEEYRPVRKLDQPTIIEETEEELRKRLNDAELEAERLAAQEYIYGILAREQAKAKLPEPELTVARKEMIKKALDYMISICDGAHTKDSQGFNKPDAAIAHRIYASGLDMNDDIIFRVTERILSRYYRQLQHDYNEIWLPVL